MNTHIELKERFKHPYTIEDSCLAKEFIINGNVETIKLCNFVAWIEREGVIDDGIECKRYYVIEGIGEKGENLHQVTINTKQLNSQFLEWINEMWGAQYVFEKRSYKDEFRYVLQKTAEYAKKEKQYMQTGWKNIGVKWGFLMPGGSEEVHLGKNLMGYKFVNINIEKSINSVKSYINSSFAPDNIRYPLIAFAYLTPLNHFLELAGYEPKTILCLIGKTGTKKSTIAALILSFFGSFHNTNLPLSFRDTANSIVSVAHQLKDVLVVLDDFHPSDRLEQPKMTTTAQTVVRAYGDRVGRGRLKSDGSLIIGKPPKGNVIITGEQLPDITESGIARIMQLELYTDSVNLKELSNMQRQATAGLFASAMSHYVKWIKTKYLNDNKGKKMLVNSLKEEFESTRQEAIEKFSRKGIDCHGRTIEGWAWLMVGMDWLLEFLEENGGINGEKRLKYQKTATNVFDNMVYSQIQETIYNKPSIIFISKLQSLLQSGEAIVIDKNQELEEKPRNFIGYKDNDNYYLIPNTTHALIKRLCERQGENFPFTVRTFLKHLSEEKIIKKGEKSNTKVVKIRGKAIRAMVVPRVKIDNASY